MHFPQERLRSQALYDRATAISNECGYEEEWMMLQHLAALKVTLTIPLLPEDIAKAQETLEDFIKMDSELEDLFDSVK